jgi:hypothetical protein
MLPGVRPVQRPGQDELAHAIHLDREVITAEARGPRTLPTFGGRAAWFRCPSARPI